jgi:hypothetical protein
MKSSKIGNRKKLQPTALTQIGNLAAAATEREIRPPTLTQHFTVFQTSSAVATLVVISVPYCTPAHVRLPSSYTSALYAGLDSKHICVQAQCIS